MTDAYIAGLTLEAGDGGAPEAFNEVEEVTSLGGIGKTNDSIEVTNFDSNFIKEYIPGLVDGSEITIECNHLLTNNAIQQQLVGNVDNRETVNFKATFTDGTNSEVFNFAAAPVSWTVTPGVSEAAKIAYTFKITGDIT